MAERWRWMSGQWVDPVVAGTFAFVVSALPTLLWHVPPPIIHDEYANLFAADTFAHGRLANPPHPLWQHFEAFHLLQQPTMSSKFPPGLSLAMAAGQWLGHPIVGVWLLTGAGCAAMAWALRAWLSRPWALGMALFAPLVRPIIWWSQTYWGGGVAMLGGALLTGAVVRALEKPTVGRGALAGAGAALLALSRPFEGVLVCLIVAAALLVHASLRRRREHWQRLLKFAAGGAVALLPYVAFQGYYNWHVTGSVTTLPYVAHSRQYMSSPLFYWQSMPRLPKYRHAQMLAFHVGQEREEYLKQTRGLSGYLKGLAKKLDEIEFTYLPGPEVRLGAVPLGPFALGIPLLIGFFTVRRSSLWLAAAVVLLLPVLHFVTTPWLRVHYLAPALTCWYALIGAGAARLSRWRVRAPLGAITVGALTLVVLGYCLPWAKWFSDASIRSPGWGRIQLIERLRAQPGDDLVLIEYGPKHDPFNDWVYNEADLDTAPVIFARSMGPEADKRLAAHYPDRKIWRLKLENAVVSFEPEHRPPTTGPDNKP